MTLGEQIAFVERELSDYSEWIPMGEIADSLQTIPDLLARIHELEAERDARVRDTNAIMARL